MPEQLEMLVIDMLPAPRANSNCDGLRRCWLCVR